MTEVVINYLLDRYAAYDVKYEEFQYPCERTFSYLNNLIFQARLFETGLFASLGKSSYQLHDAHTPFYKLSKEAKAQNKTAFASFGVRGSLSLAEDVTVDNEKEGTLLGDIERLSSKRWIPSSVIPSSIPSNLYRDAHFPSKEGWKSFSREALKELQGGDEVLLDKQLNLTSPEDGSSADRILSLDFQKWNREDVTVDHTRELTTEEGAYGSKDGYELNESHSKGAEKESSDSHYAKGSSLEKDRPGAFRPDTQRRLDSEKNREASRFDDIFWDARESSAMTQEGRALESFVRSLSYEGSEVFAANWQKDLAELFSASKQEGLFSLQMRGRDLEPILFSDSFLGKREYVIALAKEMVASDAATKELNCEGFYVEVSQGGKAVFETNGSFTDAPLKSTSTPEDDIKLGLSSRDIQDKEEGLRLGSPQKNADVQDDQQTNKSGSGSLQTQEPDTIGIDAKTEKNSTLNHASLSLKIEKNLFQHQNSVPLVKLYRILDEGGTLLLEQKDRTANYDRTAGRYLVDKRAIETHPELEKYIGLAKVMKDLRYEPRAEWTYNTSDHDDMLNLTAGGVDELLLPQLDYNYASYKEGLIDPVTLKPLQQVSELADGSFVVERPISHPIPEYQEIAKEYLDVNVSLLRHMIVVYNKTWQENIFKFGAMDMRDSVAKMLEFMDAYIQLEVPPDLQQQAYRVLRLIRWYGEASVLKNSQYRVRYVFDSLQGGFHTGDSAIPCEKENMHIDTTKHTLTNTVTSADSSVTFLIENPINTSIKMKVYQTEGSFEVILNGELQGEFQGSPMDLSFDLMKPGDGLKNELKLLYHGGGNGIINIANVVISDMVRADITTEYHPVVGSGNRVLDELIKKLAIYEDLYQNNESFFEDAVHGNLAITDLIQRLEDYFDLHHSKKSKGKRKTIRQT